MIIGTVGVYNFFKSITVCQSEQKMTWVKYKHSMLQGVFPNKVTLDTDFTDEAVVQCEVLVIKILYRWWQCTSKF